MENKCWMLLFAAQILQHVTALNNTTETFTTANDREPNRQAVYRKNLLRGSVTTWEHCKSMCKLDSDCVTFSWKQKALSCYLYKGSVVHGAISQTREDDSVWISGQLAKNGSLKWLGIGPIDTIPVVRVLHPVTNHNECQSKCLNETGVQRCTAFKARGSVCYLLSGHFQPNSTQMERRAYKSGSGSFNTSACDEHGYGTLVPPWLFPAVPTSGGSTRKLTTYTIDHDADTQLVYIPSRALTSERSTFPTWQSCYQYCQAYPTCASFIWDASTRTASTCNIFDVYIDGKMSIGAARYGIVASNGTLQHISPYAEGDIAVLQATILSEETVKDLDDCARKCYYFYQPIYCSSFVFRADLSLCLLYSAVSNARRGDDSVQAENRKWKFGQIDGREAFHYSFDCKSKGIITPSKVTKIETTNLTVTSTTEQLEAAVNVATQELTTINRNKSSSNNNQTAADIFMKMLEVAVNFSSYNLAKNISLDLAAPKSTINETAQNITLQTDNRTGTFDATTEIVNLSMHNVNTSLLSLASALHGDDSMSKAADLIPIAALNSTLNLDRANSTSLTGMEEKPNATVENITLPVKSNEGEAPSDVAVEATSITTAVSTDTNLPTKINATNNTIANVTTKDLTEDTLATKLNVTNNTTADVSTTENTVPPKNNVTSETVAKVPTITVVTPNGTVSFTSPLGSAVPIAHNLTINLTTININLNADTVISLSTPNGVVNFTLSSLTAPTTAEAHDGEPKNDTQSPNSTESAENATVALPATKPLKLDNKMANFTTSSKNVVSANVTIVATNLTKTSATKMLELFTRSSAASTAPFTVATNPTTIVRAAATNVSAATGMTTNFSDNNPKTKISGNTAEYIPTRSVLYPKQDPYSNASCSSTAGKRSVANQTRPFSRKLTGIRFAARSGMIGRGFVIANELTDSMYECGRRCLMLDFCVEFNYNHTSSGCELLQGRDDSPDCSSGDITNGVMVQGYIYDGNA